MLASTIVAMMDEVAAYASAHEGKLPPGNEFDNGWTRKRRRTCLGAKTFERAFCRRVFEQIMPLGSFENG